MNALKEYFNDVANGAGNWTKKTIFTRAHRITRELINASITNMDLDYGVTFSQSLKEVYKEVREAKEAQAIEADWYWAVDLAAKLNRFRGDLYTKEWKKKTDNGFVHRLYITELSGRRRFDGGYVHMTDNGLEYVDTYAKHPSTVGKMIRSVEPSIIWN